MSERCTQKDTNRNPTRKKKCCNFFFFKLTAYLLHILQGIRGMDGGDGKEGRRRVDSIPRAEAGELQCILVGVVLTLVVEVWFVSSIELVAPDEAIAAQKSMIVPVVIQENATASTTEKATSAVANSLVIAGVFIFTAGLTLFLVKRKHKKILSAWMQFCSLLVYIFLGAFIVDLMLTSYQVPYDKLSLAFVLWNFGVVGVVVVYHCGAENLRRGYLICCATIVAWFLTKLPPWTTWGLLGLVCFYDTFSVLSSKGIVFNLLSSSDTAKTPHRTEEEEEEEEMDYYNDYYKDDDDESVEYVIPGYDEAPVHEDAPAAQPIALDDIEMSTASVASETPSVPAVQGGALCEDEEEEEEEEEEEVYGKQVSEEEDMMRGLMFMTETHQLGMGDFVFYALLAGRSVKSEGYLACLNTCHGILLGLTWTLYLVSAYDIALPALPLPVLLGILSHFFVVYIQFDYAEEKLYSHYML